MTAPSSGLDLTVVLGARPAQAPARTRLGKPYLPGTAGFGLSDSGGVQAALYANRKYVGIDIERLDRPDLAARRLRLGAWVARRDHVPVEFLAGWVAREACAKCVGLGLLHALPRMAIAWTRQVAEGGGAVDIGLDFAGRGFVARCARLDGLMLGLCYREDYGPPRIVLLRG